jgi:fatty acid desaturase
MVCIDVTLAPLPADHRQAVAAIAPETRAELLRTSDARGLLQLGLQWSLMAGLWAWIGSGLMAWPVALLPLGIVIVFQFTALHETTHQTAFRTGWLNSAVAFVSGILTLVPPQWFRFFHFAHHRHTQDEALDPELEVGKPGTLAAYMLYLSGFTVWRANIGVVLRNALGRASYAYVPEKARGRLAAEARLMLGIYAAAILVSMWLGTILLVWLWLVPVLLGQPFLRAYLLAEHTRCPMAANMLENTRTTFTTAMVRFIAWNMPYHAEHHCWPQVPFWQLPRLHLALKDQLLTTEKGYVRFHARLAAALRGVND